MESFPWSQIKQFSWFKKMIFTFTVKALDDSIDSMLDSQTWNYVVNVETEDDNAVGDVEDLILMMTKLQMVVITSSLPLVPL